MKNIDKTRFALGLTLLLLGLLLCMGQKRLQEEALAARLAPSILRFHILANSDSDDDQNIKLEIRSLILDYMQEHSRRLASKAETVRWISEHRSELTALSDSFLKEHGFDYRSRLQITNDHFPTRVYDRLVFPGGNYDAVRITLGEGHGHNWWCVLYPRFCFVEEACSESASEHCTVPSDSKTILRQQLKKDDYLALEDRRPDLKIRLKLLSFLKP